jgi:hypothetical protein
LWLFKVCLSEILGKRATITKHPFCGSTNFNPAIQTTNQHKAQLMNYLKASNIKRGLLVNFGSYPKATVENHSLTN